MEEMSKKTEDLELKLRDKYSLGSVVAARKLS